MTEAVEHHWGPHPVHGGLTEHVGPAKDCVGYCGEPVKCETCQDSGAVPNDGGCNCNGGDPPYYVHYPECGYEPCPNGCPVPAQPDA